MYQLNHLKDTAFKLCCTAWTKNSTDAFLAVSWKSGLLSAKLGKKDIVFMERKFGSKYVLVRQFSERFLKYKLKRLLGTSCIDALQHRP